MMHLFFLISSLIMTVQPHTVFDFTPSSDMHAWYILDDGVMGGRSQGNMALNEQGHGRFYGHVSLENNGGFSSVHYTTQSFPVHQATTAVLRIKGDGSSYQFRVKENKSDYHSYTLTFPTTGAWETIEIPLNSMSPTFRGRTLDMPNFEADSFQEIAFFIANKRAEDFELLIDSIALK